ncbi:hypothetical protein NQ314_008584 [Rhamnusium bicolor]|uniref:SIAH-type domain-containing protein n=1 Tax=Rhamnusium bicolor TaxID=1586634 RepID=A0AAV8Y9N0_9CUCU|nr:hypothetical protein NQ314_008584 [Rhamnusium bicolor]
MNRNMDCLILSDKVLYQQICTECHNYLSVGPVMVSHDGKIICGRCNNSASDTNLTKSLYNLVAEKLVFKCINQYAGCKELLFFNKAIEHENNCKAKMLRCPLCIFEGNGCQLVHHLEKEHPKHVVKENDFKITFKDKTIRLIFINKNHIFCLTFFITDTSIEIFNLLVTPTNVGLDHFKLKFFKTDSNLKLVTPSIEVTHDFDDFLWSNSSEGSSTRSSCSKNFFLLDRAVINNYFPMGWCWCIVKLIDKSHRDLEEKV